MKYRETPQIHKYGESKTTRIMMATVCHVTSSSGLRKFQAAWFLLNRVWVLLFKHLIRNLSVIVHTLIQCIIGIVVPQNRGREPYRLYRSPINPTIQSPPPVPLSAPVCFPVCPYIHLAILFPMSASNDNRANNTGLVDVGQRWLEGNTTGSWEGKASSTVRSTAGGTSLCGIVQVYVTV